MLVYIIPLLLCAIGIFLFDYSKNKSLVFYWFIYVYLVVLVGVRYKVGIDTFNYMILFKDIVPLDSLTWEDIISSRFQPLSYLLFSLSKDLSSNFYIAQIIFAACFNFCIFRFIQQYSKYLFLNLFLYLLFYFFYMNMEIMRESLAIGVFLMSIKYFLKRKWFLYYLGVFIAVNFHYSALITACFPLFTQIYKSYKFIIMAILIIVVVPIAGNYLISTFPKFGLLGYYIDHYSTTQLNVNYMIVALGKNDMLPLICIYLNRKYNVRSHLEPFIWGIVILSLGIPFYPTVFSRFINYLTPISVLYLANTIALLHFNKTKKALNYSIILTIMIISVNSYNYCWTVYGIPRYYQWFPYVSIEDPKDVPERVELWKK